MKSVPVSFLSKLEIKPETCPFQWSRFSIISGATRRRKTALKRKSTYRINDKCLFLLVRPTGFEPVAYGLEVRCSIQLSYGRRYLDFGRHNTQQAIKSNCILACHTTSRTRCQTGPFSVSITMMPIWTSFSRAASAACQSFSTLAFSLS